jgi:predicted kinase
MKIETELHFFCGKAAAGKSTMSKQLASEKNAILISEDLWLTKLYPEEINELPDYVRYSGRLKSAIFDHVANILKQGSSVVLDFPGNTIEQRLWFKSLIEEVGCMHVLHYIVASDSLCKQQLHKRNQDLPEGNAPVTDEFFDLVTSFFQEPSESEGFNIKKYVRS